jgi:thioredoxin reductase (NADPH)
MAETLVIIGSGPAGWTAAVYAARANLEPLVYEGSAPLGQLNLTTEVENFPSWPHAESEALAAFSKSALPADRFSWLAHLYEGPRPLRGKRSATGPELMQWCRQQAVNFGTRIVPDDIARVDFSKRPFTLYPGDGEPVLARAVIIAAGAVPTLLAKPAADRFLHNGVSRSAVSDGSLPRFRNRQVVVLGEGDAAREDALHLTRFASRVLLLLTADESRRRWKSLDQRQAVLSHPGIDQRFGWVIHDVLGNQEDGVTAVQLRSPEGVEQEVACSGLFLSPDYARPNVAFLQGQLDLDERGYVRRVHPRRTLTSVEGVFAAGDAADPDYRQAVTAAAGGCMAALDAERWLALQNPARRSSSYPEPRAAPRPIPSADQNCT